jgi:hypothetical protein
VGLWWKRKERKLNNCDCGSKLWVVPQHLQTLLEGLHPSALDCFISLHLAL